MDFAYTSGESRNLRNIGAADMPLASCEWVKETVFTGSPSTTDTTVTVDDVSEVQSVASGPTAYEGGRVEWSGLPSGVIGTPTSSNTAACTVDSEGNLTRVANGRSVIYRSLSNGRQIGVEVDVTATVRGGSVTTYTLDGYTASSLLKHTHDTAAALDTAASAGAELIFNAASYTPTSRNADVLSGSYSLTGVAYNSARAGTAITARHLLCAGHFMPAVGATVKFMLADNSTVERNVIGRARRNAAGTIVGTDSTTSDINATDWAVLTLDGANLPSGVTKYTVPPDDILTTYFGSRYYSSPRYTLAAACIALHALGKISLNAVRSSGDYASSQLAAGPIDWVIAPAVGDSSHPVFLPLGSPTLMLIGVQTWTNGFAPLWSRTGYPVPSTELAALIDAADTAAGIPLTGLRPATADLSAYTDFSA